MKILAIEEALTSVGYTDELLRAEAAAVLKLSNSGVIREIYFKKEAREAVILLECESAEEAERILNTLPLVQHGLIRFRISGLTPYDGFERLHS